jgi:hypothetical protein
VPEISRNKNIGVNGANMFENEYNRILKDIRFNERYFQNYGDLRYLLEKNYDKRMTDLIKVSTDVKKRNFNFKKISNVRV